MSIIHDDDIEDLFNEQIQNALPSGEEDNAENNAEGDADNQGVKVEPKKRIHRNRPKFGVETLTGTRGIHTIEQYFSDIKYKNKGYEKQDLDEVLKRLKHWGHRAYPQYTFEDLLINMDRLGKKKPLQVFMSRYRLGMLESLQNNIGGGDGEIENNDELAPLDEPFDEFDAFLNEQISISRNLPRTPSVASTSGRRDSQPSTPYGAEDMWNDLAQS